MDVRHDWETALQTQRQIVELYGQAKSIVTRHIPIVLKKDELDTMEISVKHAQDTPSAIVRRVCEAMLTLFSESGLSFRVDVNSYELTTYSQLKKYMDKTSNLNFSWQQLRVVSQELELLELGDQQ